MFSIWEVIVILCFGILIGAGIIGEIALYILKKKGI